MLMRYVLLYFDESVERRRCENIRCPLILLQDTRRCG